MCGVDCWYGCVWRDHENVQPSGLKDRVVVSVSSWGWDGATRNAAVFAFSLL